MMKPVSIKFLTTQFFFEQNNDFQTNILCMHVCMSFGNHSQRCLSSRPKFEVDSDTRLYCGHIPSAVLIMRFEVE